jgi:hypothetical protein
VRRQVAFRLEDRYADIIDRWARDLAEKLGHPVSRSQAVRFILEGYYRGAKKLPEIGNEGLFELANKRERKHP